MKKEKQRVSFIYHFFPHYRAGVLHKLNDTFDCVFVGDSKGIAGIKHFLFPHTYRFLNAPAHYLGQICFQPKVILHSALSESETFVYISNPNHISTWLGASIARIRGKRVIFWGHGIKSTKPTLKNLFRRIFFSIPHVYFSYGWRAKRNAIELGAKPKTWYVGFNSLDYEKQITYRNYLLTNDHNYIRDHSSSIKIVCISRLIYTCRYDILLKAILLLARQGISCIVTFIGDGPEKDNLMIFSSQNKINATFLGEIYDEKIISKEIYFSDITVSPGKVGLTAIHSLMFGTPVVSNNDFESQMPEVEAIIPGYTGELFQKDSINDLADTIIRTKNLIKNRKLIQENCFLMIDSLYNPDKQVQVMLQAVMGIPAPEGNDAFLLFNE